MGFFSIFLSDGTKRKIASVLSVLLGIAASVPGSEGVVLAIQSAASFFGITGLVHATAAKTLSKAQIPTIVAALSTVIAIAHFVPAMAPLVGPLQQLATILGAISLGTGIKPDKK